MLMSAPICSEIESYTFILSDNAIVAVISSGLVAGVVLAVLLEALDNARYPWSGLMIWNIDCSMSSTICSVGRECNASSEPTPNQS